MFLTDLKHNIKLYLLMIFFISIIQRDKRYIHRIRRTYLEFILLAATFSAPTFPNKRMNMVLIVNLIYQS